MFFSEEDASGFFGGGGGMPRGFGGGGRGGGRGGPKEPVDTESYYKNLGIDKKASATDIKKAYRKLIKTEHPDKGGDEDKFKEIQEAYECLKDDDKRQLYDRHGKEGVEKGGGGGGDPFSSMFGGGGGRGRRDTGTKKGRSVSHTLKVTLKELYNGSVRKLRIGREVIDKENGVSKCDSCGGRGVVIRTVRMGPMIQQIQQACDGCGGQGFRFKKTRVKEVMEVHVPKGAKNGHKLVFYEKGDDIPDGDAGDVHILLDEQPHETFKRHGADLYMKHKISLVEALCGFQLEITHLDDRKLLVKSEPGEVCKPVSFDPFKDDEDSDKAFESFPNTGCGLEPMARADLDDVEKLKQVITKGQLKGKGVVAFAVHNGSTVFFKATREEVLAEKGATRGSVLYVVADASEGASARLMKCIEGEGLPSPHNPMISGNMFLMLDIEFPTSLDPAAVEALRGVLPPALNTPTWKEDDEDLEVHHIVEKDPVVSFKENSYDAEGATAEDEDEEGGQRGVQCAQQ